MNFQVFVLGCCGGPHEDNLSGYLLGFNQSPNFIVIDAGTLLTGIHKAYAFGSFEGIPLDITPGHAPEEEILRNHVKGYLISHSHLDHIGGLVINSQNDTPKPLFGLEVTIDAIRDHIFNGAIWPNYGSEGNLPIHLYKYCRLSPGKTVQIPGTDFIVEPFLLSHHRLTSTAYLIENQDNYILYVGDTGSDEHEGSGRLNALWDKIAPLISSKKLKGILMECSYPSHTQKELLYGHLTTKDLMDELGKLAHKVSPHEPEHALQGLKVIVTHIKCQTRNPNARKHILLELSQSNELHIDFIYPTQGMRIDL